MNVSYAPTVLTQSSSQINIDGVIEFNKDFDGNILRLYYLLQRGNYKTSTYRHRIIYEPKQRDIYMLPFYPDRIIHHAVMNIIEPIWDRRMYYHSYSCRKGKGIS